MHKITVAFLYFHFYYNTHIHTVSINMIKRQYRFFNNCVSWDSADVHVDGGLCSLIDDRTSIERSTFLQYVDHDELQEIELSLGYSKHYKQGLTMAGDNHVEYFRSKHHGERVYGFRHSAIEFVFVA